MVGLALAGGFVLGLLVGVLLMAALVASGRRED